MNRNFIVLMLVCLITYALLATGVMRLYKDDPTAMDLADRQKFNQKFLATLTPGKTVKRTTVIDNLGPPDITEAKQVGDSVYQVMFYRTRKIRDDSITTRDECTPLLFVDGQLIAWGKDAYSRYQRY